MVPPPLVEEIESFRAREGFENQSQALRELLRRGLRQQTRPTLDDFKAALDEFERKESETA